MTLPMRSSSSLLIAIVICFLSVTANSVLAQTSKIENSKLRIEVNQNSGAYTIASKDDPKVWITATPAAEVNHRWLHPSDYPKHALNTSPFSDTSGSGTELTVTYSGSSSQPDLIWNLRMPQAADFVEIETRVQNNTQSQITVQGIRVAEGGKTFLSLDGSQSARRAF